MKSIQQHIEELYGQLDTLAKANYMLVPQICPACRKLYNDKPTKEFMFEVGECPVCDHNYGEAMADRGDDSAKYE